MKSVGIDLEQWSEKGLLFHEAWRPTQFGIEMHLLRIHKLIEQGKAARRNRRSDHESASAAAAKRKSTRCSCV